MSWNIVICDGCGTRITGTPRVAGDGPSAKSSDGREYHQTCAPRDHARDQQVIQLRSASPMRPAAAQADANHLPLFVAANEPVFL